MNCEQVAAKFNATCTHLENGIAYLHSPLSLAFDGQTIGAYAQDLHNGALRLSDDADTLFCALTHGISTSKKTLSRLRKELRPMGLEISDDGEIYMVVQNPADAGYGFVRFVEGVSLIGHSLKGMRPKEETKFQKLIGHTLATHFGKKLTKGVTAVGASGHETAFQFALELSHRKKFINTIAANSSGGINWSSVYSNVGRLIDVKNAEYGFDRVVILQPSNDESEDAKARTALAEAASVITYQGPEHLISALLAA